MKAKKEKTGIASFTLLSASNTLSYLIIGNLTYYLTQSAAMASGTIGAIFLVSRLLDGVSDLVGGYIIDHTNTKWGKARLFDLVFIPLWLAIVLCFSVPKFNMMGKILWVFLTYNLSQTVCYTLTNGANPVRMKRSLREKDHVNAVTIGSLFGLVVTLVTGVVTPILIAKFENVPGGWTIIASIFAVIGITMSMICFFTLKELDNADQQENTEVVKSDRIPWKESVKLLFRNKYVFIEAGAFLMFSITNNMGSVVNYYFTFIVGDLAKASLVSLASMLGLLSVLFFPVLEKKLGNKKVAVTGFVLLAAGYLLRLVMPTQIMWISFCTIVAMAGQIMLGSTRNLINIDCMRYGQRQTGVEIEGLYSAVNGFGDKVGLGLGSWLIGFIMQLGGFAGDASTQTASALMSVKMLYTVVPAVVSIIGLMIMLAYNEKVVKENG